MRSKSKLLVLNWLSKRQLGLDGALAPYDPRIQMTAKLSPNEAMRKII